jgi:predicted SnoaL-like aldol condensation-catalyzing enzyme
MRVDEVADNVQTIKDFLRTAFVEGRAEEALSEYTGERYVQHNPMVPDGSGPDRLLAIGAGWPGTTSSGSPG